MENQTGQMFCDCDFCGWTMDLAVQEERDGALMAWSIRVWVRPGMKGGHRRHGLDQQEDTQAKETRAVFDSAHGPFSRRWRHGTRICIGGRVIATAFSVVYQFDLLIGAHPMN
jgi:hypothetical protein